MKHFNKLTPAQAERLTLLLEELGKAQQAIGKTLRHGYESSHPDGGPTNRMELEREIGHIHLAISIMQKSGDIRTNAILSAANEKYDEIYRYLHHQH